MSTTAKTNTAIPGYIAGTWSIDPVHSQIGFAVRHMMVSKVRGRFDRFSGEIVTAPDLLDASVTATIDLASVDTGSRRRDDHLRSPDFFDIAIHPTMSYRSTGLRSEGGHLVLDGELTLKGVTRSVPLNLEINGFATCSAPRQASRGRPVDRSARAPRRAPGCRCGARCPRGTRGRPG